MTNEFVIYIIMLGSEYQSHDFFEKIKKSLEYIPYLMQVIFVVVAITACILNLIVRNVENRIDAKEEKVI